MDRLRSLLLLWVFVLSTEALYIYEPSGLQVEKKTYTLADYISRGFAFTGTGTVESALLALPKLSFTKIATPRSIRMRRATPVKRTNKYQIVTGATPTQTHSAAIDEDALDFSYFSAVHFGSKGESLYMLLDTGSSDTWVMGSDCKSTACGTHNTFGEADSTTLKVTSTQFSDIYGTGNVTGVVVSDTVELAGLKVPLTFGSGSSVSDHFDNYPMDGLLALGRPAASTLNAPTFMQALSNAKLLPANIFGINLQRHADGTTNGEINFGAPDTSKYIGGLTYMSTVNNQNWEIPVDDVLVGGTPCKLTGNTAIIDTGTSQLFMPPAQAKVVFGQIPGAVQADSETFHIPCDTTVSIEMIFGKVPFSIAPEDYVGAPVSGNLCISTIFGVQVEGNSQWLLGDVFLKNVYSVFDDDKERIGFGAKAAAPTSTSTPGPPTIAPSSGPPSESGAATKSISPTSAPGDPKGSASSSPSGLPDSPVIPASKTSPSEANHPSGTSSPSDASVTSSVTITGHGTSATPFRSGFPVLGAASTAHSSLLWTIIFVITPSLVVCMT